MRGQEKVKRKGLLTLKRPPNNKPKLTINKSTDQCGNVEQRHAEKENISMAKDITQPAPGH